LHHFLELGLGLVNPRNIFKGRAVLFSMKTLALLLPILMRPCWGPIRRIRKLQRPKKIKAGSTQESRVVNQVLSIFPV
jgi:hypothetical protein